MNNTTSILKQYWGYSSFRPMQQEIIESVLGGNDTLALLPTGGGKSICFQVPAMAKEGLCLVVSPLIALMKDQVETLRKKNITAFALTSTNTRKETEHILQVAGNSNCKFLYVSPERLETDLFLEYLPGLGISLIAVDEAHCISQWGYDFRPSYLKIAAVRELIPDIPLLAVTASATPEVQKDIQDKLHFKKSKIFKGSFLRPNLAFSVLNTQSKPESLHLLLRKETISAIVYCRSRRMTVEIAEFLRLHQLNADFYHAGLSNEERNQKQEAWINNQTRIIVCTNAFGMGIDKPDVRLVVHYDIPDCLENYYQEAGRAGRDGKPSRAVLIYQNTDLSNLKNISDIRFPAIETICRIYESITHYLQIPTGSGKGYWQEFDITDFCSRFKHPSSSAVPAMQLLEQEGWLAYAGRIFLPAKASFTCNREQLEYYETANPIMEELIKALLRTYGGIMLSETNISEIQLAKILKTDKDIIQRSLRKLAADGIIEYKPATDKPQLQLLENRPVTTDYLIHPANWKQRKNQFEKRLGIMYEYVSNRNQCKSSFISNYFGDHNTQDCEICDACRLKREKATNNQNNQDIRNILLQKQHLRLKDILDELEEPQKEKTKSIIRFLLDEEMAKMNEEGKLIFIK
jgi:ATP-dependent DNA helicase RecQ